MRHPRPGSRKCVSALKGLRMDSFLRLLRKARVATPTALEDLPAARTRTAGKKGNCFCPFRLQNHSAKKREVARPRGAHF